MRGAWIETFGGSPKLRRSSGRAPCGARGLKLVRHIVILTIYRSRPVRGAWIETTLAASSPAAPSSRAPCGARGLKPPERIQLPLHDQVAPRAGRVD